MKAFRYILAVAVVGGAMTSCSLDEDPLYTQNAKVVFQTPENAEMALKSCYAYMTATSAFGQWWQEGPIRACGLTWGQRRGGDDDMNLLDMNAGNSWVSIMWKGMYKAINETNAFLGSMEVAEFNGSEKASIIAEARALRGVQYYYLATHFGAVPLKIIASSSDGIACKRDSREKVFEQVLKDFEAGLGIKTVAKGRLSANSVKALLAKTYMRMAQLSQLKDEALNLSAMGLSRHECLTRAQKLFKEVYESGEFELEPKYGDIWGKYYNGKECVMMLACTMEGTGDTFNRSVNRFAPTNSTQGIAWGTSRVQKFVYDYQWSLYPDDPRLDVTFLTRWRHRDMNNSLTPSDPVLADDNLIANDSVYTYPYWAYTDTLDVLGTDLSPFFYNKTEQRYENGVAKAVHRMHAVRLPYEYFANPANPTPEEIQAWMDEYEDVAQPDGSTKRVYTNRKYIQNWTTTRNEARGKVTFKENKGTSNPATRYLAIGDNNKWPYYGKMYCEEATGQRTVMNIVLYRYAEMLLHYADVENELGNTAHATSLVNEVLARARQSREGATQPAAWPSGLSQDQLREKIFIERVIETIGEPNSWDIIRMHGTEGLKHFCQLNNDHTITSRCDELYITNVNFFLDYKYNHGNLTYDWLRKNLLFPIPTSEIDANADLQNSDNNFGY